MEFRNPKYYVLPAVLFSLVIWVTLKAEINWIGNQFSTPTIDFRHFKLLYKDIIFSGERLRFTLVGAKCENIIWLFDENENNFIKGNIEVDYAFAYDQNQAPGISTTHRIDAFCRNGESYKPIMKRVTVFNRMVAGELNERENKLQVIVKPAIKNFRPKKIEITKNTSGKFSEFDSLYFYLNSENVDLKKNITVFDLSLTSLSTKTLVESSKSEEIWLRYEFTDDTDENIIFFQNPKNLIRHHLGAVK